MLTIQIINGPNLNLLGKREPEVYGSKTFEDYFSELKLKFPNIHLSYFQSNIEGELLDKIHEVGFSYDAIIINPGAYTHTSVALRDAVAGIETPVIEVHISNTHKREEFRHHSYLSPVAQGIIIGLGLKGYEIAIRNFL